MTKYNLLLLHLGWLKLQLIKIKHLFWIPMASTIEFVLFIHFIVDCYKHDSFQISDFNQYCYSVHL